MHIIADLQLHSRYSRAVSKYMDLEEIANYADRKGINLITTGDWQHPLWFKEIEEKLTEVGPGVFQLPQKQVKFLLVSELSCIYRQGGKGRRIHHLITSPSLEVSRKVIKALETRGANLAADGRPIIGLSSHDLLDLLLTTDQRCRLIPAHVWTPWFGLFGSKSGFDSISECFGDLSPHIYAIETGLSSDPHMNWQISELDNRSIVSFSDAHSGPKIGREATVFNLPKNFSYDQVMQALQTPTTQANIASTIEFFPEEGKYHWTGHRECKIRYSPEEERQKGTVCPVCGRPLTAGVEHRIEQLSSRTIPFADLPKKVDQYGVTYICPPDNRHAPYVSLIPLLEILQKVYKGSPSKASKAYQEMTDQVTEFSLLLHTPIADLEKLAGPAIATAIEKVRLRQVAIDPGYDGVFGTVAIAE